ncbi:hypothetical protein B0H13DRAFT_1882929 [Mycena leptocephala]|nr:hypothetical protein B0H13DRAFT_1882929 [Mycena leptocephala]
MYSPNIPHQYPHPAPAYPGPPQISPPQLPPPRQSEASIQLTHDADFLIQSFLPPSEISVSSPGSSGIPQPICFPQIAPSYDSPFARGYNRVLQTSVGISQEQLLAFIDGLNLAITASPPLRVVDFAGMVIGSIPNHWAMIAGNLMQIAAEAGMHVLSKTLTDRYLPEGTRRPHLHNRRDAAPRHAHRERCRPSRMKKIGRGVGTLLVQAPIPYTGRIVRAIADKPPKVPASISGVGDGHKMPLATQRRLAALEGYALPLQLDVPPPAKAHGVMDKMGSWAVAFDSWSARRAENKVEKRRRKLAHVEDRLQRLGVIPYGGPPLHIGNPSGYTGPSGSGGQPGYGATQGYEGQPEYVPQQRYGGQSEYGAGTSGYGQPQPLGYGEIYAMSRRERKEFRKAARLARKRQRGPGIMDSFIGPKETKLERQVANADLLEHWASDKVLWVVIMNAEMDREIEGIGNAESMENEERIDARTWQAEMIKERDALEAEEDSDSDGGGERFGSDHKYKYM